jgi:alanine racemase
MSFLHETGGRLTINLAALAANWRQIADHIEPADCAAVVKADAYGIGIEPAVKALWEAGARRFFVAHLAEARRVKAMQSQAIVYALNGLPPGAAADYAKAGVRPVLGSREEIEEWQNWTRLFPSSPRPALHIDTGMNRLGISMKQAMKLDAQGFRPALIMSHLACADVPDHPMNRSQLEIFEAARATFPGCPASLANSAASLGPPAYHFDVCRPGIALYGGSPFADGGVTLREVVTLQARVIQVRSVNAGMSVGYGAAQHMQKDGKIAVISVGYADGLFRCLGATDATSGSVAVWKGCRCPFVGRISMDLIAVDVTDAPPVQRGDWLTLLGEGISINDLARCAGTIPYEILTALGHRYERVYKMDL